MKILDDILPEHKRTERLDEHDEHEEEHNKELPSGSGDGGEAGNGPSDRKQKYISPSGHTGKNMQKQIVEFGVLKGTQYKHP